MLGAEVLRQATYLVREEQQEQQHIQPREEDARQQGPAKQEVETHSSTCAN
jgi:hypothetical protein